MTYIFAQDPLFDNVKEKMCEGVTFKERKAGKMRKVTAQALLGLVVWSE
jgi:hypothetical protein